MNMNGEPNSHPLNSLDEWEDDVLSRYPETGKPETGTEMDRDESQFRDYAANVRPSVAQFYRLNHRYQTLDFVRQKREQYLARNRCEMGIWEAMEFLNQLVDDSDPDIELPQIEHLLQTAEAIRADGKPRWFILTGLIHDLGKILCLWGEPQWAVVGDTFPVGCRFSPKIVFAEAFADNPDQNNPMYQTELGIYQENCGLENVLMSWGHDEYLYHVVRDYLPEPGLAMIRYHSCYPIHREGEYQQFMVEADFRAMENVRQFNPYDLYTKRDQRMNVQALKPYYQELIAEYFPGKIRW